MGIFSKEGVFMNRRLLPIGFASISAACLCSNVARAAEGKEEDEQKVQFLDVPKAVQKTLKREANGASIKTVDKEKLDGKTVYEADAKIDGHNYEIVVDRKGTLMFKKLDEEDEEKSSAKSANEEKSAKASKNDEDDDDKTAKATKKAKPANDDDEDDDRASSAKSGKGESKAKSPKKDKDDDDDKN
jgi:hypothetical protein